MIIAPSTSLYPPNTAFAASTAFGIVPSKLECRFLTQPKITLNQFNDVLSLMATQQEDAIMCNVNKDDWVIRAYAGDRLNSELVASK
jgi:hypothetical protein